MIIKKDGKEIIRQDILQEAEKIVCGKREDEYGTPEDNFSVIANMWSDYLKHPVGAVDVAMMMVLLKVARVKSGTATRDSFVDIAGYAACGGEINHNLFEEVDDNE